MVGRDNGTCNALANTQSIERQGQMHWRMCILALMLNCFSLVQSCVSVCRRIAELEHLCREASDRERELKEALTQGVSRAIAAEETLVEQQQQLEQEHWRLVKHLEDSSAADRKVRCM
jgi:hypothetical protein